MTVLSYSVSSPSTKKIYISYSVVLNLVCVKFSSTVQPLHLPIPSFIYDLYVKLC